MTAKEAESLLFKTGFKLVRQKESHRIYKKDKIRIIVPYHSGQELHPKLVKEIKIILEGS